MLPAMFPSDYGAALESPHIGFTDQRRPIPRRPNRTCNSVRRPVLISFLPGRHPLLHTGWLHIENAAQSQIVCHSCRATDFGNNLCGEFLRWATGFAWAISIERRPIAVAFIVLVFFIHIGGYLVAG